jgi:hypothetical protein
VAAGLADCRAYELVTPLDKGGGDITAGVTPKGNPTGRNQSSPGGDRLTYTASEQFGDAVSKPAWPQYLAGRDPGAGWSSHGISPPRGVRRGGLLAGEDNEFKAFSEDLCSAWLVADDTTEPPLAAGGAEYLSDLYRRANCGAEGYAALAAGELRGVLTLEVQGVSGDGGEALARAQDHLAQDAASPVGSVLKCETPVNAEASSYRWLRDGEPIEAATKSTYTAGAAEEGAAVQCEVRAANGGAGAVQATTPAWVIAPYPAMEPPKAPREIAAPSQSAPLTVGGPGGQTLDCDPEAGQWEGAASFAYRWYRNGEPIEAASGQSYAVSEADLQTPAAFQCEAIAENAAGRVAKASASAPSSPAPSEPGTPAAVARGFEERALTYLSHGAGELGSVCVLPGTKTLSKGCSAGTLKSGDGYQNSVSGAISADGSRVFWGPAGIFGGPSELYVRENPAQPQSALDEAGQCTEAGKACTKTVSEAKARFWGAARDGSKAIYAVGEELYEYEAASGESRPIAGEVAGVLGMSEDASRVYLASGEALAGENAEGRSPSAGEANLYLYEAGAKEPFAFVAALAGSDTASPERDRPTPLSAIPTTHGARVSADGGAAAFVSAGQPTGFDNRDASSGEADLEVYHYDAGAGRLSCVSCNPSGARPAGRHVTDFTFKDYWAAGQIPAAEDQLYYSRALSDNGNRLFFESFVGLVLGDTNGREDVYEWEAAGEGSCTKSSPAYSSAAKGCVSLLSSGQSGQDSKFVEASPDGSDAFFSTGASLLPEDPGLIDIYDARAGGGFAPPAPSPAPCEGEACQSPPPPPEAPSAASAAFAGPGNVKAPGCAGAARRAKRLRARAKRLGQRAKRAKRHHDPRRARKLGRRSRRLGRKARRQQGAAKRCRQRARRARR